MFIIGYSTPEKAMTFVTFRTHKNLEKQWARHRDGASVWYNGVKGTNYIGYFNDGKLIKAGK